MGVCGCTRNCFSTMGTRYSVYDLVYTGVYLNCTDLAIKKVGIVHQIVRSTISMHCVNTVYRSDYTPVSMCIHLTFTPKRNIAEKTQKLHL